MTEAGRRSRLFVAVFPPPPVLDALEALPRPSVPAVRWTTRAQWHVTLAFLGTADEAEAASALATLGASAGLGSSTVGAQREVGVWPGAAPGGTGGPEAPRRPEVSLGPHVEVFSGRVVVVAAAGLVELTTWARTAFAGIGPAPADLRAPRPHLTLARLRGRTRAALHRAVEDVRAAGGVGQAFAARFAVTEVVLVRSLTLPDGARYEPVAVVPVDGAAGVPRDGLGR